MPPGSDVVEGALLQKGTLKAERLHWLKLHGCNALIVWKNEVPVGDA